jgi:hypothetical protein
VVVVVAGAPHASARAPRTASARAAARHGAGDDATDGAQRPRAQQHQPQNRAAEPQDHAPDRVPFGGETRPSRGPGLWLGGPSQPVACHRL